MDAAPYVPPAPVETEARLGDLMGDIASQISGDDTPAEEAQEAAPAEEEAAPAEEEAAPAEEEAAPAEEEAAPAEEEESPKNKKSHFSGFERSRRHSLKRGVGGYSLLEEDVVRLILRSFFDRMRRRRQTGDSEVLSSEFIGWGTGCYGRGNGPLADGKAVLTASQLRLEDLNRGCPT